MIIADYVADRVIRVARRFEKCNWCWLPGPGWRRHDDNQQGNVPFFRCGRGAFLSAGIRSDDHILHFPGGFAHIFLAVRTLVSLDMYGLDD